MAPISGLLLQTELLHLLRLSASVRDEESPVEVFDTAYTVKDQSPCIAPVKQVYL
jgi:hypothetical protein